MLCNTKSLTCLFADAGRRGFRVEVWSSTSSEQVNTGQVGDVRLETILNGGITPILCGRHVTHLRVCQRASPKQGDLFGQILTFVVIGPVQIRTFARMSQHRGTHSRKR